MTETTTTDRNKGERPKDRTYTVTVNDQKVTFAEPKQTGADIKAAAIRAGVPIKADFVLSEVLPNGKQKPVPDDREITIKDGDQFWAIPGDDNS